jgi:lysophospholipase II
MMLMRWSLSVGAVTFSTSALRLIAVRAMSSTAAEAKSPPGALIFLHGLGDTPAGWEDTIQEELPRIHPRLAHLVYRFPHAPTIPISINGGGT